MEPKILTIDDDAVTRAAICATFQGLDCRILQAANGVEGLAVARRENPDLILLDFDLPSLNGAEVLAQLRADPELYQVPVVMVTVDSQRETVQKVLRLGVRDYIIKPFTRQGLVERLKRILPLQPKVEPVQVARRGDGPVQILVVEDKPLILEQIRQGLAKTGWAVHGLPPDEEALTFCSRTLPDLILLSLSLPGEFGYTLFELFRSHPPTRQIPILGLVVKAALSEQARAQALGFNGLITKPIDLEELPQQIARTLGLDSSLPWFQRREDCLVLTLPSQLDEPRAKQVGSLLRDKICAEIDNGLQRAVIDFNQINRLDEPLSNLAVQVVEFCSQSGLRFALVGNEALCRQCQELPTLKDWNFAPSFESARATLEAPSALATTSVP